VVNNNAGVVGNGGIVVNRWVGNASGNSTFVFKGGLGGSSSSSSEDEEELHVYDLAGVTEVHVEDSARLRVAADAQSGALATLDADSAASVTLAAAAPHATSLAVRVSGAASCKLGKRDHGEDSRLDVTVRTAASFDGGGSTFGRVRAHASSAGSITGLRSHAPIDATASFPSTCRVKRA
jgi:hypothetical protein